MQTIFMPSQDMEYTCVMRKVLSIQQSCGVAFQL